MGFSLIFIERKTFSGQPVYGQLINLLDKAEVLKFRCEHGGERYVKHFDSWQHLVVMLYAVIKRFDSLREITDSMFPEARKLAHLGIQVMPRRSTLSDANARRPKKVFESIYRSLYARYKDELSSDSRKTPGSLLAPSPANHRLNHNNAVFQPHLQGCRPSSEGWKKERGHQGSHKHPCQRGGAV